MKTVMALLLACCCWLAYQKAEAAEQERFRGGIGIGVMTIHRADNLDPKGSKRYLDNLDSGADPALTVIPLIAPQLSYDVGAPGGLVLNFYIRPPIEEAGGLVVNLGGSYYLPDGGSLEIGVIAAPLEEVWKDPYLVGARRSTTDSPKYGMHLAWNKIRGSGLGVHAVYVRDEVKNDQIGRLIPELARDGAMYALAVEYDFPLSETLKIRPRAIFLRGEYDGEASSFYRYKGELKAHYRLGALTLMPGISYRYTEFDQADPLFAKTRKEDDYSIDLLVSSPAPFGWQGWSMQMLAGYGRGDNTIAFYDTRSLHLGAWLIYHF